MTNYVCMYVLYKRILQCKKLNIELYVYVKPFRLSNKFDSIDHIKEKYVHSVMTWYVYWIPTESPRIQILLQNTSLNINNFFDIQFSDMHTYIHIVTAN